MNKENDHFIDNEDVSEVIDRYEEMLRNNTSCYFDVFEFENIIAYYMEQSRQNSALQAVQIAQNQHPDSIEILIKQAQVLLDKGHAQDALNIIQKVEKIETFNPEIFMIKGHASCLLDNCEKAVTYFDEAIRWSGEEKDDVIYSIALIFIQVRKYSEAVSYLKMSLEIDPDNDITFYDLAYCYDRLQLLEESIEYYKKYVDKQPFAANAWYNMGIVYNKLENFEGAIEAYDFALAIDNEYIAANFNKANTLANNGDYKQAIDAYQDCLVLDDENPETVFYIGECYEKLNEFGLAFSFYEMAVKCDPEFSDAWFGMGIVMMYEEKNYESLFYLKKAIKLDHDNSEYWYVLAGVLKRLCFYKESKHAYKRAVAIDPDDEEYWLSYADLLYHEGEVEEATELLKEASAYIVDNALISYKLATYHLENKKSVLGLRYLEDGLTLDYSLHPVFLEFTVKKAVNRSVRNLIKKYKPQ